VEKPNKHEGKRGTIKFLINPAAVFYSWRESVRISSGISRVFSWNARKVGFEASCSHVEKQNKHEGKRGTIKFLINPAPAVFR
jgi:hypothetical protein